MKDPTYQLPFFGELHLSLTLIALTFPITLGLILFALTSSLPTQGFTALGFFLPLTIFGFCLAVFSKDDLSQQNNLKVSKE